MTLQNAPGPVTAAESVLVRRAGPEDAGTVRTLLLELAAHEQNVDAVRSSVSDWRRLLADAAVVVLLAELDGRPVGYVSGVRQLNLWLGGDLLAMDDLYVRADHRDRGVGGRLMAVLADHARGDQLVITWGVDQDNVAGQRFYRRLGATLRTKTVASWLPRDYESHLAVAVPEGEKG